MLSLKAFVDHLSTFTNVSVSRVNSAHNAGDFCNSTVPALVESGCFVLEVLDLQLGMMAVLPHLIGYPTYPLLLWLMWIYIGQLDPCQAHFNQCLGQTCALVECAFGT
ncbi:hypothetical protein Y1Q_0007411 [Alligator mississippiensis]|uniref:Uncharacterized protein n=1 Tax=Alligator mississippiensis TaxID=8496 RepID=A0A151P7Q4_ALLMI|nr:hypothetical protein Y1Q_0007411 [Alligator mississippiensis]